MLESDLILEKILKFLGISQDNVVSAIVQIVLAVLLFICLYRLVISSLKRAEKKILQRNPNGNIKIIRLIRHLCLLLLAVVFAFSITAYFPAVNKIFSSLLAGSGIIALIISVASQDAISNFVGGLIIAFSKIYEVGDIIRYVDNDISGVVEEITIRHTVIRTFENKRLIVPNSIMNSTAVESSSYGDSKKCIMLDVGITYSSDTERAMKIFAEVIRSHPKFFDNRSDEEKENGVSDVKVRVISFDQTAIIIRGWVWAESGGVGVDMKSDILLLLKKRFEEEGIFFATPRIALVDNK